jgi:hypothetical protein
MTDAADPDGAPADDQVGRAADPDTVPAGGQVRRAARATRDAGLGYGLAVSRAGIRAVIGLGRAGTDVALRVLEQGPVGDAAGAVADRLEPAAERGRRARAATAEEMEGVMASVVDEVIRLVGQVDVDGIVRRVDVDGIVRRVDIEDIISRVDVDGIVRRTEVGTLIVQSTGGLLTELLDFVRSLGVSLDAVSTRVVDRLIHKGEPRPVAPTLAVVEDLPELVDGPPSLPPSEAESA